MWNNLWWNDESESCFNRSLSGLKLDFDRGKMIPRSFESATEVNWLFFGSPVRHMDCGLWHGIMFRSYNFVPSYCRLRCYKVVVKIPTVETLIRFHSFAQTTHQYIETCTPLYGKCGIDERYYTDTPYDAFFYCDGLEDGLEKYRLVRSLMPHFTFAPDLPVVLKRTCTEFEKAHGPTDAPYWKGMTPEEIDLQRHLEDIYDAQNIEVHQPGWLINKIYRRWCKFANTHGDKSWLNYYSSEPDFLTMKAVTYHHLADQPEGKDTNVTTITSQGGT